MLFFAAKGTTPGMAQTELPPAELASFVLSVNEDFSTNDRIFGQEDIVYFKIDAPDIDFTGLTINEYSLVPDNESESVKGDFFLRFT